MTHDSTSRRLRKFITCVIGFSLSLRHGFVLYVRIIGRINAPKVTINRDQTEAPSQLKPDEGDQDSRRHDNNQQRSHLEIMSQTPDAVGQADDDGALVSCASMAFLSGPEHRMAATGQYHRRPPMTA